MGLDAMSQPHRGGPVPPYDCAGRTDHAAEVTSTARSRHEFWRDHLTGTASTTTSKEDALTDRQFQLLLEGARRLDDPFARQARFVIFATDRLGMRAGEVTHMTAEWIDWHEKTIHVHRSTAVRRAVMGTGPVDTVASRPSR